MASSRFSRGLRSVPIYRWSSATGELSPTAAIESTSRQTLSSHVTEPDHRLPRPSGHGERARLQSTYRGERRSLNASGRNRRPMT